MHAPLRHLGDMPVETFLRDYWQQKPLLVRGAFADFHSPVDGDELAGLALEEEVESRLILERGATPWELRQGPFSEETFATLPESHWTLLVQAVDQWVPEVHALLGAFRFLPDWRLDDVMVSYAADQGSVGPHFDYYDVFLLQGQGRRRWRLGAHCDAHSAKLDDTPLNILQDFTTEQEWLLEPGDMLYIPPGLSHWGTAEGECLTYSIGFRAPSYADILCELTQAVAEELSEDHRYSDPGLSPAEPPGRIDAAAIERVRRIVHSQLTDERIARWFGRHMTERKYPELDEGEEAQGWQAALANNEPLVQHPAARLAYRPLDGERAELFADGEATPCSAELARCLCERPLDNARVYQLAEQDDNARLIAQLIVDGTLVFDEGVFDDGE